MQIYLSFQICAPVSEYHGQTQQFNTTQKYTGLGIYLNYRGFTLTNFNKKIKNVRKQRLTPSPDWHLKQFCLLFPGFSSREAH